MRITAVIVWLVAFVALSPAPGAYAQNTTTGTVTGVVKDTQGRVLPGTTVVAVHLPTGTTYEGVTDGDGRFLILNVRTGGPYEIRVNLGGFRGETVKEVNVAVGQATEVPVMLQLATLTESVTVTADTPRIDPLRVGTASNVSTEAIEALPTVSRSLSDFARLDPNFVTTSL